jgi:hypothetical protein
MVVIATAASATTVAAGRPAVDWRPAVDVRTADGAALQDADFLKRNVGITWQEPGSTGPRVGIRTSVDSGNGFGPTTFISRSRQSALDVCGGSGMEAAWARRDAGGDWDIKHASLGVDPLGGGVLANSVANGPAFALDPDVACTGSRTFVSWFEREAPGDYRMNIAYSDPSRENFGPPNDLGLDAEVNFARNLAVAGVNDAAYAVFTRSDGDLRFKRWSIGPGPGFAVNPHAAVVIGGGTTGEPIYDAVIAAAGDRVAVAWGRCNNLFTRVSDDGGASWGPVRSPFGGGCIEDFFPSPTSINLRGNRIALTYHAFGLFGPPAFHLIRTTDEFMGADPDDRIAGAHDQHLVGYVTTAGGAIKLGDAFDTGDRIRYRRQQ